MDNDMNNNEPNIDTLMHRNNCKEEDLDAKVLTAVSKFSENAIYKFKSMLSIGVSKNIKRFANPAINAKR